MNRRDEFFDTDLIARLSRLEITAQRIVDGFLAGKNRSNRHGVSVEFVEHREYVPGDDLRHLDWKVLGRMDRYYIKRYEEETNITACILVDSSASMTYRPPGSRANHGSRANGAEGSLQEPRNLSKFEIAAYSAAALSYLLNRQRDSVSLGFFDTKLHGFVPPSVKRVAVGNIARALMDVEPQGKTSMEDLLFQASHNLPRRCLFIILSDLFLPPENLVEALRFLEHRSHDALILHTLSADELEFPFRSNVLFRGLEDRRELLAEPHRLRKRYLELMTEFLADTKASVEGAGFDYQLLNSGEALAPALASLLAVRARRKRVIRKGVSR